MNPGPGAERQQPDPARALLDLLSGHRPVGQAEEAALAAIRGLVRDAPRPWARDVTRPGHLTASAILVDPERRRTLLVFHTKLARWLQPGGHFEPDERDPHAAAAREALEETGLATRRPADVPPLLDLDVHEIPARPGEPAHLHFDLRVLLEVVDPPAAHAGDGVERVRWVAPDALDGLGLDPGLRRALGKVPWAVTYSS